jgi:hypothetical protein
VEDITMKLIGKALIFGIAAATASVAACSTGPRETPSPSSGSLQQGVDGTGSVGFKYTLPGGDPITTITYKLTT